MNPSENSEEDLFLKWLELPPNERQEFSDTACPNDPDTRKGLLELIRSHEESEDFLDALPKNDFSDVVSRLQRIAPSDESVGDQIGRYRLIERIGEGAWGAVWKAEQTEDIKRQVALKILKLGLDTKDFLIRFEAERQMLALMDHSNIATIYDAGATDYGRPYLVMELVNGKPLIEFADEKQLSVAERVELFIRICQALDHAHKQGVIHRDIKPSNILVAEKNDEVVPKVIDFGVAKTDQFRLGDKTLFTSIHTFIGTPLYSSPEQLDYSGKTIDARSDVYSLGAVLYELLSGVTPFDHDLLSEAGLEGMRTIIREQDPPVPSQRFSDLAPEEQESIAGQRTTPSSKVKTLLNGDLDWVIMKSLEKEPDRRYESASALGEDLRAFLDCRPVSAAAPSVIYRTRKFIRRNRLGPVTLGVGTTALVLLLVYAFLLPKQTPLNLTSPFSIPLTQDNRSVAVLPFENLGANNDNDFIAAGLHGELTSSLARIQDLKTISRESTMRYKDTSKSLATIGRDLGVVTVVTGDVQLVGENMRVNVRLIDVIDDRTLWGDSYTRVFSPNNFFEIQSEISAAIASELQAALTPEESQSIEKVPTQNLEALAAYLKAQEIISVTDHQRYPEAIELFEKAIELDPQFAEAYGGLASALFRYGVYFFQGGRTYLEFDMTAEEGEAYRDELHKRSREVAAQGLELDDSVTDLKLAIAWNEEHYGDREKAKALYEEVIEEDPNNMLGIGSLGWWYSNHRHATLPAWKRTLDDPENVAILERIYELRKRTVEMASYDPQARMQFVLTLHDLGRNEEAFEVEKENIRLHPDSPIVYGNSSLSLLVYGRFDEAMVILRKHNELQPGRRIDLIITAFERLGDVDEATRWAKRAQVYTPSRAEFYEAWMERIQGDDQAFVEFFKHDRPENFVFYGPSLHSQSVRNHDLRNGLSQEQVARYVARDPLYSDANIVELVATNDAQLQDKPPTGWCILALELAAFLLATDEREQAERLLDAAHILLERHVHSADWKIVGPIFGAPGDGHHLYYQAIYYTLRNDNAQALDLLGQAVEQGFRGRLALADARFDPLREASEFVELMNIIEADLAQQLTNIRRMELNGELAAIPPLPADPSATNLPSLEKKTKLLPEENTVPKD